MIKKRRVEKKILTVPHKKQWYNPVINQLGIIATKSGPIREAEEDQLYNHYGPVS